MTLQPMIAVVGVVVSVSGCFFFHAHFIAGSQFVSYEHEAPGERDQGVGGGVGGLFIILGLLWTTFVFASFLQASMFF